MKSGKSGERPNSHAQPITPRRRLTAARSKNRLCVVGVAHSAGTCAQSQDINSHSVLENPPGYFLHAYLSDLLQESLLDPNSVLEIDAFRMSEIGNISLRKRQ